MAEPILVIGHRNPDLDAIASAVGYAWVLNAVGPERYVAGRPGEVNAQTAFVLSRFQLEAPALVVDIWARVGDLAKSYEPLHKGENLLTAVQRIARAKHPLAVLDEDNKPLGLLTGEYLFGSLAEALSSTSVLELARSLDKPVETALNGNNMVLAASERVRDVIGQVLRSDHDEFMVVDDNGKYVGLSSKSALLAPSRRKLVIVDHNELQQAVPGLEDAELVEVLDHHRLGNLPTAVPIRFVVEPVGSCSTLVAEACLEHGQRFPAPIAGLLLCGILSDTLVFRSPTTTRRDKVAAEALAEMAGLETANGSRQAAIEALGAELLAANAGLGERSADEVVNADLKFYEANGAQAGIAQVEIANFREMEARLDDLKAALTNLADTRKLALSMLMVTDVVRGNSRLVVAGQPRVITALPYAHLDDGSLDAPGIVSRKKQLLPVVLAALSQNA